MCNSTLYTFGEDVLPPMQEQYDPDFILHPLRHESCTVLLNDTPCDDRENLDGVTGAVRKRECPYQFINFIMMLVANSQPRLLSRVAPWIGSLLLIE